MSPPGESPVDAGRDDDLQLVSVDVCGPVAEVELGKIARHGDGCSAYCGRKTQRQERRFTIEYRFDGATFRRLTAIPREVTETLNRY